MPSSFSLLLTVLRSTINPDSRPDFSAFDTLNGEAWQQLFRFCNHHDLAHFIGHAILTHDLPSPDDMRTRFERQAIRSVVRCERQTYDLERFSAALAEAGIPFLPLKGATLRAEYPEPWMRTGCDIDILIPEDALESAQRVLEDLGCRFDTVSPYDISGESENQVHIELHRSLQKKQPPPRFERPLAAVWEHTVNENGRFFMDDAMQYYYHLAHMAGHMQSGGCGIRPFMDLWILMHRENRDCDGRRALLEAGGLTAFAEAAEQLASVWFGNAAHTDLTVGLERYVLRGGNTGTSQNALALWQSASGGRLAYWRHVVWLPTDAMQKRYPSLIQHPHRLWLCQLHRWITIPFHRGIRSSLKEVRLASANSNCDIAAVSNLLEALELTE